MSRRNRRGFERPTGEAGGAADEEEAPAEEGEPTDEQQETSIADLTATADPETFDRTYLLDRDDVPLAVDETPAIPRPWEGLPRMAMVYNFNYEFDDGAEEWVRQNPDTGGGGGGISAGAPVADRTQLGTSSGVLNPLTTEFITDRTSAGIELVQITVDRDANAGIIIDYPGSTEQRFEGGSGVIQFDHDRALIEAGNVLEVGLYSEDGNNTNAEFVGVAHEV